MDDLLQALQAQLQGLPQPQSTPADVFRMQQEAMMSANRAGRMRTPVSGAGPLGAVVNYMGRKRGNEAEQAALDQLVKAMEAQGGIDQYQKQYDAIQAQIDEAKKWQQKRDDFVFEESFKEGIKSPDKVKLAQWALSQSPEVRKELQSLGIFGGPSTTVNVGDNPDWTNKRNEKVLDANQELWQLGAQSGSLIPSFDLALGLLDKVETGPLTERVNAAKRYGQALGMDVDADKVAQFEQLSPIFGELTMQRIQQTKGAVSNKEMEMFKLMNANYEYSTEGNRRLIQFAKAKAERDVAVRQLISQLRNENLSPMEIAERVDQFVNENDLSGMIQDFVGGTSDLSGMSDEELLRAIEGA